MDSAGVFSAGLCRWSLPGTTPVPEDADAVPFAAASAGTARTTTQASANAIGQPRLNAPPSADETTARAMNTREKPAGPRMMRDLPFCSFVV